MMGGRDFGAVPGEPGRRRRRWRIRATTRVVVQAVRPAEALAQGYSAEASLPRPAPCRSTSAPPSPGGSAAAAAGAATPCCQGRPPRPTSSSPSSCCGSARPTSSTWHSAWVSVRAPRGAVHRAGRRRGIGARHGIRVQHLPGSWTALRAGDHRAGRGLRRQRPLPGGPPARAGHQRADRRHGHHRAAGRGDQRDRNRPAIADPSYGKTGTAQNNKDAWFVGYTCDVSTAVWMGHVGAPGQEVPAMTNVHGRTVRGGIPAEMWRDFMERIAPLRRHDCPEVVVSGQEFGDDDSCSRARPRRGTTRPNPRHRSVDLDRSGGTTFGGGHPLAARRLPRRRLRRRRSSRRTGWRPRGLADRLMGVVGAAHEAPLLRVIDHVGLARLVPGLEA